MSLKEGMRSWRHWRLLRAALGCCFKRSDAGCWVLTVCLFLQDAGLLALVAAAQIADVPPSLHAQPEAGPSGLQQLPYKEGHLMAVTFNAAVSKQRGVRGGRRASRKRISGITPEHMLYWVLQADIAVQLRCEQTDGVVSMSQESDMPSESNAADALEAGNAAVPVMDVLSVPLSEAAQKHLAHTRTPSKAANQHNNYQSACAQKISKQK